MMECHLPYRIQHCTLATMKKTKKDQSKLPVRREVV
jgi:hypothetical protein